MAIGYQISSEILAASVSSNSILRDFHWLLLGNGNVSGHWLLLFEWIGVECLVNVSYLCRTITLRSD